MKNAQGDMILKRKDVPEPDASVTFTVIGDTRYAWRIIPHVAHYTEGWRYDVKTGDLIGYGGCYTSYTNPKYVERAAALFPKSVPLQRWDSKNCRCSLCGGRKGQ